MYKLLIVDDEQIEREGMAHFIQWDKYDIQLCGTAWNGADALGKIQKDVPDIVLTDIKMPVMNGIELIQKLSETYRNIVVVVLSGYGEYEFTSQAMEYGIRHYILKPCDEDKIVAVMNDAKKEVDKRREYHTLKRELLPHAKDSGLWLKPGMFFSVSETSKVKEECAKFINWFVNSNEANEILLGERGTPVSSDVRDNLIERDKLSEQQKEAFEYTDKVSAVVGETPAADPSGIAEVNEAFASAGNSVLYGQLTSKEAAKQFREKANAILERNNAQ